MLLHVRVDTLSGQGDLNWGRYGTRYLPAWLGHVLKIREVVLDPRVDVFQGHALPLGAVDGELDHGHVRVRGPLGHGVLPGCRCTRGLLNLGGVRSRRDVRMTWQRSQDLHQDPSKNTP